MARDPSARMTQSQRRESLADPNYKGQDYEIDTSILETGPMANRRCTDILCLFIFLGFVATSVYVGIYSVANGDTNIITTPYDSNGKFCGKSPGYEEYPYLWYSNIESNIWFAYAVCV